MTDRPGLAGERTRLAWGRSGLSLLACGAVLLGRVAPLTVEGHRPLAGMVAVAMGVAVLAVSVIYRRRQTGPTTDPATMRLVAYTTASLAAVAIVVGLAS